MAKPTYVHFMFIFFLSSTSFCYKVWVQFWHSICHELWIILWILSLLAKGYDPYSVLFTLGKIVMFTRWQFKQDVASVSSNQSECMLQKEYCAKIEPILYTLFHISSNFDLTLLFKNNNMLFILHFRFVWPTTLSWRSVLSIWWLGHAHWQLFRWILLFSQGHICYTNRWYHWRPLSRQHVIIFK
jgi:hypothetical protein